MQETPHIGGRFSCRFLTKCELCNLFRALCNTKNHSRLHL